MKIEKILNFDNTYDIKLTKDGKTLTILFSRVLDLHMVIEDGVIMPFRTSRTIDFDINTQDKEVYELFDKLYNDVINGNIFEKNKNSKSIDSSLICSYNLLVDENKNIIWVSDDGIFEDMDRMQISKINDAYRITFVRTDKMSDLEFKSPKRIYIRLRTSGSRYDPFHIPFMRMYKSLQNIDEKEIEENDSKVKKELKSSF